MFAITYVDEIHSQWNDEYLFNKFEDAKQYLIDKGFIENNRVFEREELSWITYRKAYINPMKLYFTEENTLNFKYVITEDWYGIVSEYEVKSVKHKGCDTYSIVFKNSRKDLERKVVTNQDLFQ